MSDLTTYTDADLDALRVEVLVEQERRARVAAAPEQIASLTRAAVESGVTEAAIRAAVENGLTPEQLAAQQQAAGGDEV